MKITLGFGSLKKRQSLHVKWPFHSLVVLGTLVFFKGFLFKHDPRQGKPDRRGAANGSRLGGLWEAPPPGPTVGLLARWSWAGSLRICVLGRPMVGDWVWGLLAPLQQGGSGGATGMESGTSSMINLSTLSFTPPTCATCSGEG